MTDGERIEQLERENRLLKVQMETIRDSLVELLDTPLEWRNRASRAYENFTDSWPEKPMDRQEYENHPCGLAKREPVLD